jgi:pimeloyl-ACP methyl ester carboxylesterase
MTGVQENPPRRPTGLHQALARFTAEHPASSIEAEGIHWRYVRTGGGGAPVLMLGGVLGQGEFSFLLATRLESRLDLIVPDYPPLARLDAVSDGLAALLDHEGIAQVHVVGGSFGGVVAQAFAWRHPERVASLTLSHSGAARRVRGAATMTRLLQLLPERLLRALMRKRLRPVLATADPFWTKQFDKRIATLTKAEIVSRVQLTAEFGERYGEVAPPPGIAVQIIESEDDPLFPAAERERLQRVYPAAEIVRFSGTGHITSVLKPAELAEAVAAFVLRVEAGR